MASLSNGASAMAAMLPVGVGMQDVSMGQAPPLAAQQPLAPPASLSVTPTVTTSVASSQQVDVTTNATANALVGESPLSVISVSSRTLKKKKPGRSPSQIWLLLTDEPNPQRRNAAACKHCKQQVLYYKKSEQAVRHLKKCSVFQSNQHQYGFIAQFQDILPLYQQKITQKTSSKKRQKAAAAQAAANAVAAVNAAVNSAGVNMNVLGDHHQAAAAAAAAAAHHHANVMNSLAMQQGMADNLMDASVMQSLGAGVPVANVGVGGAGATSGRDDTNKDKTTLPKERKTKSGGGALTKVQQERFEDALAMHAYVTGMAFDAMEETHLQRALLILKSNAKLPDKKRFESDLLLRCYDKMYKRVWGYLTASSTRVCIKRDAWSTMNLYNTNNPEDVYVTYMAVNSEKRFFLESEKVSDDAQYNSILIAQDIKRVMAPIVSSVSGVVTGSTQFHARAWEMLKAEYPTKFFYGCITHALHLAIMDIFGPEKSLENDPRRMTPQLPMDFPFQDLVDFTNNCNELISFFSSYQYAPKFKMFDAQTLQTMKSFSNASPTMQWGTLAARFRVLLQSEDIIQSIVSDPDFIVSAPVNQRSTRQNMKDVVMSLNWKITLEKAINILQPIELILYKFQDDKAPISEVYFESKHLLTDFDAVFGLSPVELEYIKKVVTERWQYVLGEAHALAFLLDPRYIGKSMTREYREHIEELIFKFPETDADIYVNEERKRAISAEYTDYVIYAKNQRANETFKWEMLDKGTRTPLQFWQAEADEWPHLKQLALTLFSLSPSSVASEKSLCKASLVQSSRRNKLSFDDMRRLAFITINDTQFTNNRMGDFQNTLPDFSMGDPGLSEDGMMMWMI